MTNGGDFEPYEDEPEAIPDDAVLLRRVSPAYIEVSDDGTLVFRGGAFQDASEEWAWEHGYPAPAMSVHLLSVLESEGKDPSLLLEGFPRFGLVRLRSGDLREHGMGIQRRPTEDDPSHAVVFAIGRPKRSGGQQKRTRDAAAWEITPPASDA